MKTTHKEESLVRITNDASDRNALKETLSLLIGPLNPSDHEQGQLLNIVTGQLTSPECNVDEAYDMVAKQMKEFRDKWPGGFYDKISKQLINIGHKRRHISVDNHKIISQDLIYARALGLLVRNRDLNYQEILTHKLVAYPPALFEENGAMRVCKNKATLKNQLKIEVQPH